MFHSRYSVCVCVCVCVCACACVRVCASTRYTGAGRGSHVRPEQTPCKVMNHTLVTTYPVNPVKSYPVNPVKSYPVNPVKSYPANPVKSYPYQVLPCQPCQVLPLSSLTLSTLSSLTLPTSILVSSTLPCHSLPSFLPSLHVSYSTLYSPIIYFPA